MGRKRSGTIEQRGGKFYVRLTVSLDNGKKARRRALIPGVRTLEEAEARKGRVAAKATGMVFAAHTAPSITFGQYLESLWIPARKRRGLKTASKDRERLRNHVVPVLGKIAMQDIVEDDVRSVVERLDEKMQDKDSRFGWRTARHVWMSTRKLFKDACKSKVAALRVLTVSPAANVEGPDRGAEKSKQWLYPMEFAQLMACPDVPLRWRRIYAVATLLFLRWGEVRALAWRDIDLVHGIAHVHEQIDNETSEITATKTEDVRDVPIEPSLMPLLRAMRREQPEVERLFDSIDKPSLELRAHLLRAGVGRSALHRNLKTSLAVRFHDLRATGITWMAIRGDSPMRIRDRAGHTQLSQTEEYIRRAELVGSNVGAPFPTLPPSVLGPAESSQEKGPVTPARSAPLGNQAGTLVRRRGLEPLPDDSASPQGELSTGNQVGSDEHGGQSGTIQGPLSGPHRVPGRRPPTRVQDFVAEQIAEAFPHLYRGEEGREHVLAPLRRAARALDRGKVAQGGGR